MHAFAPCPTRQGSQDVEQVAAAGHLQSRKAIAYSKFASHLPQIRDHIPYWGWRGSLSSLQPPPTSGGIKQGEDLLGLLVLFIELPGLFWPHTCHDAPSE
jgi:hypothetical protein